MKHKCFISYKREDVTKKNILKEHFGDYLIDNSLEEPIPSKDPDYIMSQIRKNHLSTDSTVTICLIGQHSSEELGYKEQQYIKRELQASLYNGKENTRNGVLGIVLPEMYDSIYHGSYPCSKCHQTHNTINLNDQTVIKEFSANYYLDKPEAQCGYHEDNKYCVLVKWDDFINIEKTQDYIQLAFDKRSHSIADKVKVRL